MSSFLSQFKPELKQKMNIKNKKILCIVEGKEELKYIYNLFKLNGAKEQCDELSKNKIKVSWGRDVIVVNKCNFKGGGCYKDIPVPVPAQESLEFEKDNLWLYDSIIVMFDGDKDNFSSLTCFNGVGHLIANLDKYPNPNNEILVRINDNIKTYMKEVA